MRFGLSTHLYHGLRLERGHLERIRSAGFDLVEVFATRTHFDYHDARAIATLHGWTNDLGLRPWSMHAPICDGFTNGEWGRAYSIASTDAARRQEAIDETTAAIDAAARLGCAAIVLHLGIPRGQPIAPGDNDPGALRRGLEAVAGACARKGVRLALEVIPNDLATPPALLEWLNDELDLGDAAACVDVGHAHIVGGAPEAVELLSGYLLTTHIHDNNGQSDDHLVPFDGTIDWAATMGAFSKVGYDGPLVLELPDLGDADRTLTRAASARKRLQQIIDDFAAPLPFGEVD